MKIKQSEAVKAYRSLQDLNRQKMSSNDAKQIYSLFKKLQEAFEFQTQEERKIFAEHPNFDIQLGGIRLDNKKTEEEKAAVTEELKDIEKELKALSDLDFEISDLDFPIDIFLDNESNLKISGEDIGNLEKLINFN